MPRLLSKYENLPSSKKEYNKYMNEYGKLKVECNCGQMVRRGGLYVHKRSNKHLQQMLIADQKQKIDDIKKTIN
jgi:hypothetical protein